jgi:hypothetical protein
MSVSRNGRGNGRPVNIWEDNFKIDLKKVVWDGVGWIHLAQDREQWQTLVNAVMNLRLPHKKRGIS